MRVHPGPIRVPPPNRPLTLDHCTESGGGPTAWPGQSTRVIIRPALPQLCICRPSKAYWGLAKVSKGLCRIWLCWLALCVRLSPFQNGGTWWCCHWLDLRSGDLNKSGEIDPLYAKADFCWLFLLKLKVAIEVKKSEKTILLQFLFQKDVDALLCFYWDGG